MWVEAVASAIGRDVAAAIIDAERGRYADRIPIHFAAERVVETTDRLAASCGLASLGDARDEARTSQCRSTVIQRVEAGVLCDLHADGIPRFVATEDVDHADGITTEFVVTRGGYVFRIEATAGAEVTATVALEER